MAWLYIIIAGICEIVWAYGLKATHGFSDLKWSLVTIVFLFISFYLFAKSIREISIGTAYAVFTGIGAAGTAIIGVIYLSEGTSTLKLLSLSLLVLGIIGLKLIKDQREDTE